MTQYAYNLNIHSIIDINFFYVMYDSNSEIKFKIENDFFRKKVSTVKKNCINLNKRYRNVKQTLSNYKSNIIIKSINQKLIKRMT